MLLRTIVSVFQQFHLFSDDFSNDLIAMAFWQIIFIQKHCSETTFYPQTQLHLSVVGNQMAGFKELLIFT
jgi:hypothetical protein